MTYHNHQKEAVIIFWDHVIRRGKMEHVVTTEQVWGKRDRGRQCKKNLDHLLSEHGCMSAQEVIYAAGDHHIVEGHGLPCHSSRHSMMMWLYFFCYRTYS